MKKTYVMGAVFVALLLCSVVSTASARTKYFLQIDGVDGESTDADHEGWIEVIGFAQEISKGAMAAAGLRTGSRPQMGPLVIVKSIDKASPKLSVFCCSNTNITSVVLSVCRSGGSKPEFMRYTLGNAVVSAISVSVDAAGVSTEIVSLTFGSIQWRYTEIDAMGKAKGTVQGGWDVIKNKSF